jgi:hypothetical protein
MGLIDKLRSERGGAAPAQNAGASAAAPAREAARRPSNGLKDFLWLLGDVEKGQLLDLGPVAQSTVSFFTERGFKIYSEDLLTGWKEFLGHEEKRLRASGQTRAEAAEFSRAALAERFLQSNLRYASESFHAILLWDLLDYLDEELLAGTVARLYALLRPNGVVLGLFHSKKPEALHHYRIPSADTIELLPSIPARPTLRELQNRDLMNLFSQYRSSKTFVGRDQIREALFLK